MSDPGPVLESPTGPRTESDRVLRRVKVRLADDEEEAIQALLGDGETVAGFIRGATLRELERRGEERQRRRWAIRQWRMQAARKIPARLERATAMDGEQ